MRELGVGPADVRRVYLAGAFGNYIRPSSALTIGLMPHFPNAEVVPVGNAAGSGARLALLSRAARAEANRILEGVEYLELSGRPDFQDAFAEACCSSERAEQHNETQYALTFALIFTILTSGFRGVCAHGRQDTRVPGQIRSKGCGWACVAMGAHMAVMPACVGLTGLAVALIQGPPHGRGAGQSCPYGSVPQPYRGLLCVGLHQRAAAVVASQWETRSPGGASAR